MTDVVTPPAPPPDPTKRPVWVTWLFVLIITVVTGIGAASSYGVNIPWGKAIAVVTPPGPAPAPTPAPGPAPSPFQPPGTVWSPHVEPSKNEVPGLKLPAPTEVPSGTRYVQVTADSAKPARWLIGSKSGRGPVSALESPLTNSVLIFPDSDDTLIIVAYSAAADGTPTLAALTTIKVGGGVPTPPAPPVPTPTPAPPTPPTPAPVLPTHLHVTFVLDPAKQTRAISDIVNDKGLRASLTQAGHEVHELSVKDDLASFHLDSFVNGKQPPVLILQTMDEPGVKGGEVIYAATVTSIQQVKDAITKVTGGK